MIGPRISYCSTRGKGPKGLKGWPTPCVASQGFGGCESLDHLFIRRLVKALVPFPDGERGSSTHERHNALSDCLHSFHCLDTPNRYGDDEACCTSPASHLTRREGAGTGRQAIVDDDDGSSLKLHRRLCATVQKNSSLKFRALVGRCAGELLRRNPEKLQGPPLSDYNTVFADGSHGELKMSRHTDLSHHNYIQR